MCKYVSEPEIDEGANIVCTFDFFFFFFAKQVHAVCEKSGSAVIAYSQIAG